MKQNVCLCTACRLVFNHLNHIGNYIATCMCVTIDGVWIGEYIDHFTTRFVITNNYNAIANLHTLQITAANTKSSRACNVFTRRFLVTDFNTGYSCDSGLKSCLNGGCLPTASVLQLTPRLAAISHQLPNLLFTHDFQLSTLTTPTKSSFHKLTDQALILAFAYNISARTT
jgi:hypothetical protein